MSDFSFIGRYSIYNLDFAVVNASGTTVDADAGVNATFKNYATGQTVWARATTHVALGVYRLTISSLESATPGLWYIMWDYAIGGVAQQYRTDIEISASSSPLYSTISDEGVAVVDSVWGMFADLFDSRIGGPHLKEYAQTSFGRETVATLMGVALGMINTIGQPSSGYTMKDNNFPFTQWGALLEQATRVQVIKHLMTSYVEQPEAVGVDLARLDRRDYLNRWNTMYDIEKKALDEQVEVFKMSMMNIGRPSIIVGGGAYGNYGSQQRVVGRPRRMPGF